MSILKKCEHSYDWTLCVLYGKLCVLIPETIACIHFNRFKKYWLNKPPNWQNVRLRKWTLAWWCQNVCRHVKTVHNLALFCI